MRCCLVDLSIYLNELFHRYFLSQYAQLRIMKGLTTKLIRKIHPYKFVIFNIIMTSLYVGCHIFYILSKKVKMEQHLINFVSAYIIFGKKTSFLFLVPQFVQLLSSWHVIIQCLHNFQTSLEDNSHKLPPSTTSHKISKSIESESKSDCERK